MPSSVQFVYSPRQGAGPHSRTIYHNTGLGPISGNKSPMQPQSFFSVSVMEQDLTFADGQLYLLEFGAVPKPNPRYPELTRTASVRAWMGALSNENLVETALGRLITDGQEYVYEPKWMDIQCGEEGSFWIFTPGSDFEESESGSNSSYMTARESSTQYITPVSSIESPNSHVLSVGARREYNSGRRAAQQSAHALVAGSDDAHSDTASDFEHAENV